MSRGGVVVMRVLVIGSGGAGKSTLALALARRLQLPVVHLDRLYWQPGWRETPTEEWQQIVETQLAAPAWIMDGNYGGTLELRLAACDTVVFLDLPRLLCLWRVVVRQLRFAGRSRPDMTAGCPERLTANYLRWIWSYPSRRRPAILASLAVRAPAQRMVVLGSRRMVQCFLDDPASVPEPALPTPG